MSSIKRKILRLKFLFEKLIFLLIYRVLRFWIEIKWKAFRFYYDRLILQARFLYRQSSLYKYRWQEFGLDFAEKSFENDVVYFFNKARNESLCLRWQLFLDGLLGREFRCYY